MTPIHIFSLAKHDGPYEAWPPMTALFRHGQTTGAKVPGYIIEAQYQCGDRYLLATSWDCPFEEMQTFVLLSSKLRVLSERNYGAQYASVWMTGHEPVGPDTVAFHCCNAFDIIITVRARRPFLIGSLLKLRVVDRKPAAPGAT